MATQLNPGFELPLLLTASIDASIAANDIFKSGHSLWFPAEVDGEFFEAQIPVAPIESRRVLDTTFSQHDVRRVAAEAVALAGACRQFSFLLEVLEVAHSLPREQLNSEYFSWESGSPMPTAALVRAIVRGDFNFEDEEDAYLFDVFSVSVSSPFGFWARLRRSQKTKAIAAALAASSPAASVSTAQIAMPAVAAVATQAVPAAVTYTGVAFAGGTFIVSGLALGRTMWRDAHNYSQEIDEVVDQMRREIEREDGFVLQRCLTDLGLYDGAIDGRIGPATRRAAQSFMDALNMPKGASLSDPGFLRALATEATRVRHGG